MPEGDGEANDMMNKSMDFKKDGGMSTLKDKSPFTKLGLKIEVNEPSETLPEINQTAKAGFSGKNMMD
mgnify:CR=1 FL=1